MEGWARSTFKARLYLKSPAFITTLCVAVCVLALPVVLSGAPETAAPVAGSPRAPEIASPLAEAWSLGSLSAADPLGSRGLLAMGGAVSGTRHSRMTPGPGIPSPARVPSEKTAIRILPATDTTTETIVGTTDCATCHDDGPDPGVNVLVIHENAALGCYVCHDNPTRVPAIVITTKACVNCHATEKVDYHRNMDARHVGFSAGCIAPGCHANSRKLPDIHAAYAGPGREYSQFPDSCALCHRNVNENPTSPGCTSCHVYQSGNPHWKMNHNATSTVSVGCVSCHEAQRIEPVHGAYYVSSGTTDKCATCHDDPVRGDITWTVPDSDCEGCHSAYVPFATAHYPVASHEASGETDASCAKCHRLDMKAEHVKPSSGTVSCATCHETKVDALTGPWDGTCLPCHAVKHDSTATAHASAETACDAGCHDVSDVAALHSKATTTVAGTTYSDCYVCHRGADAPPTSSACSGCHAGHGDTTVQHTATDAGDGCVRCHAQRDVRVLHGGDAGCVKCHDNPTRVPELPGSVECVNCHAAEKTDYHRNMDSRHIGFSAGCIAPGCHANSRKLPDIHAAYVGAGREYSQFADSCALCHVNETENPTSAACASCHAYSGNPHYKMNHNATSTVSAECLVCHGPTDTRIEPVHKAYYVSSGTTDKCATCHDDPVRGDITWTVPDADCEGCHPGEGHPHPVRLDGIEANGERLCLDCHADELAVEHAKVTSSSSAAGCDACHLEGGPRDSVPSWGGTCSEGECHKVGTSHAVHDNYCLACHDADRAGFAVNKVEFTAPKVDPSACRKCHWISMNDGVFSSFTHGHADGVAPRNGPNCGKCHPSWMGGWSADLSKLPVQDTPHGFFADSTSPSSTAPTIHDLHVNGSWPKNLNPGPDYPNSCRSCHGPAGCGTCHSDPDVSTHLEHTKNMTTGEYATGQGPITYHIGVGTASGLGYQVNFPETVSTCANDNCHSLTKAGDVATFEPACSSCHPDRVADHGE